MIMNIWGYNIVTVWRGWAWSTVCLRPEFSFTQFGWLSLLSVSLLCSSSPTPPGAPNCFTTCWVLLNCSSVSRCFMHLRYMSSVSFRAGSGSLGRPLTLWETDCESKRHELNLHSTPLHLNLLLQHFLTALLINWLTFILLTTRFIVFTWRSLLMSWILMKYEDNINR